MIICEYVKSIMEKFSVVLFCVRLYKTLVFFLYFVSKKI